MKTPLAVFPTEVILIDDDMLYAQLFAKNLAHSHGVSIKTISNTDFILRQKNNDFLFTDKKQNNITCINDLTINFEDIRNKLNQTIAVVIADLHMEKISGLEFLKNINSPFVYKILISNFIDTSYNEEINIAINSGAIHAFWDKKNNLPEMLAKCISTGRRRFFSMLGEEAYLTRQQKRKLLDSELAKLIWTLVEKLKPEYMSTNNDLNKFQFINRHGKTEKTLFINTYEDTKLLLESYQAELVSPEIKDKLRSNNFMIANESPYLIDGKDWINLVIPAKRFKGRYEEYVIGILDGECNV